MMVKMGRGSVAFDSPVYMMESASIVGAKEGEGPYGKLFDQVGKNDLFGGTNWEEAESNLQKEAVSLALQKANRKPADMDLLFAGDLLGQSIASSFGLAAFQIPLLGLYGACSTCGEALLLAAIALSAGAAQNAICVTSSHFASAEKEFRFPLEYGNQRPLSASWTVTGSAAFVLSNMEETARAKITGATIGKIVDYGMKDSMNMGACMAPAAADTIVRHFTDFSRTPKEYDRIITGDLGRVGQEMLLELVRREGFEIADRHMDCGIEIYDSKQDAHAGGSGCGCCAVMLSAYIIKKLCDENGWNRVLFVPTGAMLSKVSYNEGKSVPAIAHGIVFERI